MGLLYVYPQRRDLTEFTVFGDSSLAPSGRHSQSGFTVHLSFGKVRHLIHWQSLRESKVAESSAESELYVLASARKAARTFRLLIRESFTTSVILSLRCDNNAAISMLEEPGWRTRYISIHGEAARQEMINRSMVLTYVSTDRQLADPLDQAYIGSGQLTHLSPMGIGDFQGRLIFTRYAVRLLHLRGSFTCGLLCFRYFTVLLGSDL